MSKGRSLIGILLAITVALPATARVLDRIAATVNNEVILLSEVDLLCQTALDEVPVSLPLAEAVERKLQIRKQALEALVEKTLFRQQTRKNKIVVNEEDVDKQLEQVRKANNMTAKQLAEALAMDGRTETDLKKELRKQLEKQKLIDVEMRNNPDLRARIQISEKDVAAYYQAHYLSGAAKEKVRASHILFLVPPQSDPSQEIEIRKKAEKALGQLKAGKDFGEVAKEFSDDPSGAQGGDLGWFRRGDMMAAFEKVAFALGKDKQSDLVRTKLGYHIILVTDRGSDGAQAMADVERDIRGIIYREKFALAMSEWLGRLRQSAFIDIKL